MWSTLPRRQRTLAHVVGAPGSSASACRLFFNIPSKLEALQTELKAVQKAREELEEQVTLVTRRQASTAMKVARHEQDVADKRQLALLIDADNTSWKALDLIMAEIELGSYGTASARRIYGDWTGPYLSGWKFPLRKHAITPIQQFTNTAGKNNTDSAMIIDAMDLLHSKRYDVSGKMSAVRCQRCDVR